LALIDPQQREPLWHIQYSNIYYVVHFKRGIDSGQYPVYI